MFFAVSVSVTRPVNPELVSIPENSKIQATASGCLVNDRSGAVVVSSKEVLELWTLMLS